MNSQGRMTRADMTQAVQAIEAQSGASDELKHLLRELQRHQLELEVQNHELQEAQQALEESRNRYMELYDFAPMACVSLNERACIQDLNLTGAALLGQDRQLPSGPALHPLRGSAGREPLPAPPAPLHRGRDVEHGAAAAHRGTPARGPAPQRSARGRQSARAHVPDRHPRHHRAAADAGAPEPRRAAGDGRHDRRGHRP